MEVFVTRRAGRMFNAQLRIHAEPQPVVDTRAAWAFGAAAREPATEAANDPSLDPGFALSLKVEDLRGHSLFASHDPAPLTYVPLAAGIYRVTARQGEVEHHYLMVLGAHESVDMHVRLDACRPFPG
jgi:3-hydroxyisobutyrate dehydrogenase-like beta-hydroxyacid dehydrogenase